MVSSATVKMALCLLRRINVQEFVSITCQREKKTTDNESLELLQEESKTKVMHRKLLSMVKSNKRLQSSTAKSNT